jgi:hypothetical protein
VHDEGGLAHVGELFLHVLDQPAQFPASGCLEGPAIPALELSPLVGLLDQGSQPRILDAPAVALGN